MISNEVFTSEVFESEQAWLKGRMPGIGGSAASAILGMNPYKTNVQLWEEKTGRRIAEDISDKVCVEYGKNAEYLLRELFKLDYPEFDVYHKEYEILTHRKHPFLKASLDGVLTEKATGKKGILEIKTTNILQSMQREKWNDKIPDNYYIQVLHYLLVTEYDFVIIKAHMVSMWDGEKRISQRHYRIDREDVLDDLEYLFEQERNFWEKYVLTDKRPPLVLPPI